MMNRLYVASWGLLLEAAGQAFLCDTALPFIASWAPFVALLRPWLTVYTISFCRQAPFGPRRLRHRLTFSMCWYATATVLAEVLRFLTRQAPRSHVPSSVARVITYAGMLSFIVFVHAC